MSPGTAVNPSSNTLTAPQTIKTYPLDVTDDEYVTVQAEFYISQFVGSPALLQAIPLVLNIGANTTTVNVRVPVPSGTATNALGNQQMVVPLWLTAVSRGGDIVTAQLGVAAAGDTGTYVNVIGFKIVAESGTRSGT